MNPEILLFIIRIILAIILYAFLAIILIHLWKDLQLSKSRKPITPEAHLEKIAGDGLETSYSLEGINLIGRASDNTLILNESSVSGYHARLSFQQDQWWLEDLGSRNGTFVNDLPVTEPLVITYGDLLGFGNVRMRLVSGTLSTKASSPESNTEKNV